MKVGIDLGTTYSSVAYIDDTGEPRIIPNSHGNLSTPSIIAFSNDGITYGEDARQVQYKGSGLAISAFKRSMGNPSMLIRNNGIEYNAEKLSSMLLKHLIEEAEKTTGQKVESAVITVPAYFDDLKRKSTINAAEKAGIKVSKIVNEPTAAAYYYGMREDTEGKVIVYDLGGGTFDITLFEIKGGKINVIGTHGNSYLGGKDWDYKLMDYIFEQFEDDFDINPKKDAMFRLQFLVEIEKYKCMLSEKDNVNIPINYKGNSEIYQVKRSELDHLSKGLVQRTIEMCDFLLDNVKMSWDDFDSIILTGGSTRIPSVRRELRRVSGIEVVSHDDTDVAVAKGAALFADQCGQDKKAKKQFVVVDVAAHSLGNFARSPKGDDFINEIILEKNTSIPCSRRKPFGIDVGNTTDKIEIYVLQGESTDPHQCTAISKTTACGIKNDGKGLNIDVEFSYRDDGVIEVKAFQDNKALEIIEEALPSDYSWMNRIKTPRINTINSENMRICIAIDLSKSMEGKAILETIKSVKEFINRFKKAKFSLVLFSDRHEIVGTRMTSEETLANIENICDSKGKIKTNIGFANGWCPFSDIKRCLSGGSKNEEKIALVLTDGVWQSTNENPIIASQECMKEGIKIVAIGFGTADPVFIRNISNTELSGLTDMDSMSQTFDTIARAIELGTPMLLDD